MLELPPLARGILFGGATKHRSHGITPACAGNTHPYTTHPESLRNYPRLRGEYRKSRPVYSGLSELPPLARGIRGNKVAGRRFNRITPACAGNTSSVNA